MDNTPEKELDDCVYITKERPIMFETLKINTASPFKDLFQVKPTDLEFIEAGMKAKGFEFGHPLILWAGHNATVVDGHTRLAAAKKLMFARIPVILKEFKDEAEALEFAIESQVHRRNLNDAELMKCMTELDKRMSEGRPKKTATGVTVNGRSSENTAKLLGTSRGKVEKIRAINDHGTEEVKEAVKSGEMSVNKAYTETMDAHRESQFKDAAELYIACQTALENGFCGMIQARVDRELTKHPNVRYFAKDIAHIRQTVIEKLDAELAKLAMDAEN